MYYLKVEDIEVYNIAFYYHYSRGPSLEGIDWFKKSIYRNIG